MNEATKNVCACNPCSGSSCNCGCQNTAASNACACGPQCRCDDCECASPAAAA